MRPLRLGHRGCRPASRSRRTGGAQARRSPAPAPLENTLAAFEFALDAGCDGFELDLRRTLDGRIVVHHDPRLAGLPVARTPYETLRRQEPRLTTLDDVLARFSRRAWIDIEVKSPGFEPELAAQLRRRPVTAGCVISSFQPRILLRLAACLSGRSASTCAARARCSACAAFPPNVCPGSRLTSASAPPAMSAGCAAPAGVCWYGP